MTKRSFSSSSSVPVSVSPQDDDLGSYLFEDEFDEDNHMKNRDDTDIEASSSAKRVSFSTNTEFIPRPLTDQQRHHRNMMRILIVITVLIICAGVGIGISMGISQQQQESDLVVEILPPSPPTPSIIPSTESGNMPINTPPPTIIIPYLTRPPTVKIVGENSVESGQSITPTAQAVIDPPTILPLTVAPTFRSITLFTRTSAATSATNGGEISSLMTISPVVPPTQPSVEGVVFQDNELSSLPSISEQQTIQFAPLPFSSAPSQPTTQTPTIFPTTMPTMEPVRPSLRPSYATYQETANLTLSSIFDESQLQSNEEAFQWILEEDQVQLEPMLPDFVERFVLSSWYLQTRPWRSCNYDEESSHCQFEKLVQTPPSAPSYLTLGSHRWLSPTVHHCQWAGIQCNEYTQLVESIQLGGHGIAGTLPKEFNQLQSLTSLNLMWNNITGMLPAELARVEDLQFQHNQLTGTVGEEFFSFSGSRLQLTGNLLTGIKLPALGGDGGGISLFLGSNLLKGTIPTRLGDFNLTILRLDNNNGMLTGTIPTELGRITSLKELWISGNLLSGTIPAELGQLDLLRDLRLFGANLNGTIPYELFRLSNLERLDLYQNDLSGTLPNSTNLASLKTLRLWDNPRLQGTVPSALTSLVDLQTAHFELTGLEAAIDICPTTTTKNEKEWISNCLSEQVACSCCVECCNATICCTDDGVACHEIFDIVRYDFQSGR